MPVITGRRTMALVTLHDILPAARKERRAVGAFNVANYECALAAVRAAEGEGLPVIIQIFQRLFRSEKGRDLAGTLIRIARRSKQPVVIHLDHGAELAQVGAALASGCTSVMFDGSMLPFDENAKLTSLAAELAHAAGATCEGEIGHVAMGDENAITTLEDAVNFYEATKVDAMAISIGTVHGFYKSEPKIDIGRCREISEALPELPLVLHGGSGTPLPDLRKAVENGVSKINIATEYMDTFLKSVGKQIDLLGSKFKAVDLFMDPVIDECTAHAARLLRFFAGR